MSQVQNIANSNSRGKSMSKMAEHPNGKVKGVAPQPPQLQQLPIVITAHCGSPDRVILSKSSDSSRGLKHRRTSSHGNLSSLQASKEQQCINGWCSIPNYDPKSSPYSPNSTAPEPVKGCIYKRRRFPFKGSHQRFFLLDHGILVWWKTEPNPSSHTLPNPLGEIDLSSAAVNYNRNQFRIYVDANGLVHHLSFKRKPNFEQWLWAIEGHRKYKQASTSAGKSEDLNINALKFAVSIGIWQRETLTAKNSEASSKDPNLLRLKSLLNELELSLSKLTGSSSSDSRMALSDEERSEDSLLHASIASDNEEKQIVQESRPKNSHYKHLITKMQHKSSKKSVALSSSKNDIVNQEFEASFVSRAREYLELSKQVYKELNVVSVKEDPTQIQQLSVENVELKTALAKVMATNKIELGSLTDILSPVSQEYLEQGAPLQLAARNQQLTTSDSSSEEGDDFQDALDYGENFEDINSDNDSEFSEDIDVMLEKGLFKPIDMRATLEKRRQSQALVLASRNPLGHRTVLPAVQPDCSDFSIVNLLYKNIGRDLSKIRLPVKLNEPLSALQRLCEEMEYSNLLDKASDEDDPLLRMAYVAAFAVSCYSSSFYRAGTKPFNPLMGETFELIKPDLGWKFLAEQISHHPPGAMAHCESDNWTLEQQFVLKNKFWGKSIEAFALGGIRLSLPVHEESYTWTKVPSCISNLMSPPTKRSIDAYGPCIIECKQTKVMCKLRFHKAGDGKNGENCYVTGSVVQSAKNSGKKLGLHGHWNESLFLESNSAGHEEQLLWKMRSLPARSEQYYRFTQFAIELNEQNKELDEALARGDIAPTDSRFRPDQRALENGELDLAEQEKYRVETDQRNRLAALKTEPDPVWFKKCPEKDGIGYEFTDEYWKVKEDSGFKKLDLAQLW